MYNRYVFDPDGSCRKDQVPEPPQPEHREQPKYQEQTDHRAQPSSRQPEYRATPGSQGQNPLDFLKGLLPGGFDTGDLIIILLLLLMSGDSKESHDSALLTMALYFIL